LSFIGKPFGYIRRFLKNSRQKDSLLLIVEKEEYTVKIAGDY
jgi:hypothetical protein